MHILRNYIKITFRSLLQKKVFSAINIFGLAIALASCMLIGLYVLDELSFDRFHQHEDQIFRIITKFNEKGKAERKFGASNSLMGPGLKAMIPEISDYVRVASSPAVVRINQQLFEQEGLFVDPNFLGFFSFPLLSGNAATALHDVNSVILTKKMAQRFFGSTDVLGKTIELKYEKNFKPFIVTGVAEDIPANSSIRFGILIPIYNNREIVGNTQWLGFTVNTFLMLKNKVHQNVESKVNAVYGKMVNQELLFVKKNAGVDAQIQVSLQSLKDIHLNSDYINGRNGIENGSTKFHSYLLIGIALFILLIAGFNFVNLSTASAHRRNKEIGVRKVIGGRRIDIMVQFLSESMIVCFLAFSIAIVMSIASLDFFNRLSGKELSYSAFLSIANLSIFVTLFLITGLLAGFYPAVVSSAFNPIKSLKSGFGQNGRNYFGKMLIVLQFAFATILIIGTAIVYGQYEFLTNKDLGYNDDNLLEVELRNKEDKGAYGFLKKQLESSSLIESVSGEFYPQKERVKIDEIEIDCDTKMVDVHYLKALHIPLLQGRDFSKDLTSESREGVIVNEAFLKETGIERNILGKQFGYGWTTDKSEIVGVVKDFHFESLKEKIKPLLLKVYTGDELHDGKLIVKYNSGAGPAALKLIRESYNISFPYFPFLYSYTSDINRSKYGAENQWKKIISLSTAMAIFLSCIGLLGLTILSTESRSKEIGIRKVLGSSVAEVAWLFAVDFVKIISFGVAIAMPIAWLAQHKWLMNFAYKIEITWILFAICGLIIFVIAVLPVIFQSIKASLKNPVEVLASD